MESSSLGLYSIFRYLQVIHPVEQAGTSVVRGRLLDLSLGGWFENCTL